MLQNSEWIALIGGAGLWQSLFLNTLLYRQLPCDRSVKWRACGTLFLLTIIPALILFGYFRGDWSAVDLPLPLALAALGLLLAEGVAEPSKVDARRLVPGILLLSIAVILTESWLGFRAALLLAEALLALALGWAVYRSRPAGRLERGLQAGAATLWLLLVFYSCGWTCILSAAICFFLLVFLLSGLLLQPAGPLFTRAPAPGAQSGELYAEICAFVEAEALYREPGLTVAALAQRLDRRPWLVSQALNDTGVSFPAFINGYRLTAAKRMLRDERYTHLTVAAIAYECGFNSLSTFHTAFKEETGTTPGAYRFS